MSGMVYELQLDFLEAQGLPESVKAARAEQQRVAVCLPRVLKPNEVADNVADLDHGSMVFMV